MIYPHYDLKKVFNDRQAATKYQRKRYRTQRAKLVKLNLEVEEYIDRATLQRNFRVTIAGEQVTYLSQVKQDSSEGWFLNIQTIEGPLPELDWDKPTASTPSTPKAKRTSPTTSLSKSERRKRSRKRRREKRQRSTSADHPTTSSSSTGLIIYLDPSYPLPRKGMYLLRGDYQRWFFCQVDHFDGDAFHASIEDPTWPEDQDRMVIAPVDLFREVPNSLVHLIPNPFGPNHS